MLELAMLVGVGLVTGFINVFAGGGSLISFPLLILLGLPVSVANGTNKLGLVFGGLAGGINFLHKGEIDIKEILPLIPVSLVGVFIGSKLSIDIDEKLYVSIISIIMVLVLIVVVVKPQRFIQGERIRANKISLIIIFSLIGFYAGFIQIGMGYLVIIALSLATDFTMLKITAYKVLIAGAVFVTTSAVIFIFYGKVVFAFGLSLGVGNALGAYIGSNMAIKNGDKIFKPILVLAVIGMSIKLSGIYKLFV